MRRQFSVQWIPPTLVVVMLVMNENALICQIHLAVFLWDSDRRGASQTSQPQKPGPTLPLPNVTAVLSPRRSQWRWKDDSVQHANWDDLGDVRGRHHLWVSVWLRLQGVQEIPITTVHPVALLRPELEQRSSPSVAATIEMSTNSNFLTKFSRSFHPKKALSLVISFFEQSETYRIRHFDDAHFHYPVPLISTLQAKFRKLEMSIHSCLIWCIFDGSNDIFPTAELCLGRTASGKWMLSPLKANFRPFYQP